MLLHFMPFLQSTLNIFYWQLLRFHWCHWCCGNYPCASDLESRPELKRPRTILSRPRQGQRLIFVSGCTYCAQLSRSRPMRKRRTWLARPGPWTSSVSTNLWFNSDKFLGRYLHESSTVPKHVLLLNCVHWTYQSTGSETNWRHCCLMHNCRRCLKYYYFY